MQIYQCKRQWIELDILLPFLIGIVSYGEGNEGVSCYDSGESSHGVDGQSGSHADFRFVFINNNNNVEVINETTTPEPPELLTCEVFWCKYYTSRNNLRLSSSHRCAL